MTSDQMQQFLYRSESESLDFKEMLPKLAELTDEKKSEILKDVLAFANSWRNDDAYILIGIKPVMGGPHETPGMVEEPFDDAQLQQFINSKTNRKVALSYECVSFQGVQLGVISIPKQPRPTFATAMFGKVQKHAVYYRMGSSTNIAKPDEIAAMGAADAIPAHASPTLDFQFADIEQRTPIGTEIAITCTSGTIAKLPDFGSDDQYLSFRRSMLNREYWREMASHMLFNRMVSPISSVIANRGRSTAIDARVVLELEPKSTLLIGDRSKIIDRPSQNFDPASGVTSIHLERTFGRAEVVSTADRIEITLQFGKIQPHASAWSKQAFFLGATASGVYKGHAVIYADNLAEPVRRPIAFTIDVQEGSKITLPAIQDWIKDNPESAD